jgi:hypothetical protein
MATELEHIALANRNHDALCVLLAAKDKHPEWVATIAFYKALQIVEATFANKGIGHGHGHTKRLQLLQDKKNGYAALVKHYEALIEASEVARYLGGKTAPAFSQFSDYMSMADVKTDLLSKRLMNVETHARAFLSAQAKADLKKITDETALLAVAAAQASSVGSTGSGGSVPPSPSPPPSTL